MNRWHPDVMGLAKPRDGRAREGCEKKTKGEEGGKERAETGE